MLWVVVAALTLTLTLKTRLRAGEYASGPFGSADVDERVFRAQLRAAKLDALKRAKRQSVPLHESLQLKQPSRPWLLPTSAFDFSRDTEERRYL